MYTVNSRWQCNAAVFKTIEADMVSVSVMVFKYCRSMSNDYMNLYYRCILARIIYFLTTIIAVLKFKFQVVHCVINLMRRLIIF